MKIVRETAHRWDVECDNEGCDILISVPKRIRTADGKVILADAPTPRRCILCGPMPKRT